MRPVQLHGVSMFTIYPKRILVFCRGGGDINKAIREAMKLSLATDATVEFEHNGRNVVVGVGEWFNLIHKRLSKQEAEAEG